MNTAKCTLWQLLALTMLTVIVNTPVLTAGELLPEFEAKTTTHVLDNGWTFIVVERPVAPVFSFATFVDVGSAQEVPGITGLAHMFEHMAFKGTPNIGTHDYQSEKVALAEVETAYQNYDIARRSPHPDTEDIERLRGVFEEKQAHANTFVVVNEFGDIIDREGGRGLNAFTNTDFTGYFYSLPANKLELFAYLESERFLHPVFREFYKERDVVQEERRMRTESRPIGRLIEQALSTAYVAHPYKQPVVGYMSDLQSFTVTDAQAFYSQHYVPANMVTAVVGYVDTDDVIEMAETYFGRIPKGPKPAPLRTVEPQQFAEKAVTIMDPSQPVYLEVYHKPSDLHTDAAVYKAIDDVMSNGRTSRLYRSLVRDLKIAAAAGSFSSFPGQKYPSLWLAFSIPSKGHSNEEVQAVVQAEIERLKTEDVSDAELQRFRTRAKADLLRQLRSNAGLAQQLAQYQTVHGDWRQLFREIDDIEAVTKADIRRVANQALIASNRTVATIVTDPPATTKEEATDTIDSSNAG